MPHVEAADLAGGEQFGVGDLRRRRGEHSVVGVLGPAERDEAGCRPAADRRDQRPVLDEPLVEPFLGGTGTDAAEGLDESFRCD
ncbi:hypothetical protein ACFU93_18250 [Streptomyces sp. NPDC057611]|uniref:hypothetical protein n=1 Tax=Streptomyces sp. NPDC057611 TaxID=3346182 RepID=UPI00367F3598